MIALRPMTDRDLAYVKAWLHQPHVARWWTPDTTPEAVLEQYRKRLAGEADTATTMLTVVHDDVAIGWCQWYLWQDYPEAAEAMDALPGEAGIDYAIGEPGVIGQGLGTELVAALVAEVRRHRPNAGVLVDPNAANWPSRRVLERNGFELVAERPVACEPSDEDMAIYRLSATSATTSAVDPPSLQRRLLLVDAANVIGSRPDGWWRDRPGAARCFIEQLRTSTATGALEPPVVVVVEGAARSGIEEGDLDGVRVLHAAGEGDDLLVELSIAAAPEPVVLVSADRELRRRVEEAGGSAVGPGWLRRQLGEVANLP